MHDEFITTIERLKSFYTDYDNTTRNIINLFDRIDCNGGTVDNELEEIFIALNRLWENDKSSVCVVATDKAVNSRRAQSIDELVRCWQLKQEDISL